MQVVFCNKLSLKSEQLEKISQTCWSTLLLVAFYNKLSWFVYLLPEKKISQTWWSIAGTCRILQ